jgi:hypothetical protein
MLVVMKRGWILLRALRLGAWLMPPPRLSSN